MQGNAKYRYNVQNISETLGDNEGTETISPGDIVDTKELTEDAETPDTKFTNGIDEQYSGERHYEN